jgi:hypothetical protein
MAALRRGRATENMQTVTHSSSAVPHEYRQSVSSDKRFLATLIMRAPLLPVTARNDRGTHETSARIALGDVIR